MQTTLMVIGVFVIAFVALMVYSRIKLKNTPLVDDHKNILSLTDKNFNQQTKNKLVLVDFWAEWCAPCRMMAPVLNELAGELTNGSHIGKVNIEKYNSLAQTYKVRSIPTLILFKNGKEINRFVGVKNKDFLIREMNKVK